MTRVQFVAFLQHFIRFFNGVWSLWDSITIGGIKLSIWIVSFLVINGLIVALYGLIKLPGIRSSEAIRKVNK